MISDKQKDYEDHVLCKWIIEAEDTNQSAERVLVADSVIKLRQKEPNIEGAIKNLMNIADSSGSLVKMPEWFCDSLQNIKKKRKVI